MFVVILLLVTTNSQCYNEQFLNDQCSNGQINNSCSLLKHYYNETINEIVSHIIYSEITRELYQDSAIVVGVLMCSLIFSTLFISNCIYKKMIDEFVEKYNNNKLLYDYDPYFFTFLDEYDLSEKKEMDENYLNSLCNKYIKENTPCGDVILNYNNEYNSFDYYCKKSNSIGFNYLEVVSRIYVVNFDCKNIYNDNFDNLSVLYNIKYGIDNTSLYNEENSSQDTSSCVFFSKNKKSSKNNNLNNYVSNKYKYKGTLDEFNDYCTINNLKICYSTIKDVSENILQDSCSCFFYLEKKAPLDDLGSSNVIKSINFKSFKTLTTK